MAKGKRGSKKRKMIVHDDEPKFIRTIYTKETQDEKQIEGSQPEDTQPDMQPWDTQQEIPPLETQQESQPQDTQEKESEGAKAHVDGAKSTDEGTDTVQPNNKKRRGPTKMKDIARDPNARIKVDFTAFGEPCGEGSVKLSSYLGPLVREHVPVVIDDWRKIGDDRKTVLWKSVQYEKAAVMKQMGCIWRASKSRLVNQILNAENHIERLKLRPDNIQLAEWKKFVKEKTSKEFRV
ncbi:hypothetical protein BRARA_K01611 [Brassica rapa]|uniref:Uncharacterized protein n=1 Tax=Brassica campestris TaxID=3711 RepID=A0A397L399_BRACM|nr:hypothetical protein BRARA_K01611 [Brassica rapa]